MHDLGSDLLLSLTACPNRDAPVGGVVIYDASDSGLFPAHAIVLGVGVQSPQAALAVVRDIRRHEAVALVVRLPFDVDDDLLAAIDGMKMTLVGLAPGATWHQLTTLLGVALADPSDDGMSPDTIGGFASGDLFGLANAICELIDAPVTIEDRNANVLAFSDRQDEADHIRIETILDRRVPEIYSREDETRGAARAIRQAARPVFLQAIDIGDGREALPRVAVAIRAGDEFLGTIWAVVREPLSPEEDQLLLDASRLVALHMLQLRAGADAAQRLRTDLVATALDGGTESTAALVRLDLAEHPLVVVALGAQAQRRAGASEDPYALARQAAESQRAAAAFALHMAATCAGSVVALVNGVIYAIVPAVRQQDAEINIELACRRFLKHRLGQPPMVAGIGRVAQTVSELVWSRNDAERTVRVLRSMDAGRQVAQSADVEVESLLLEIRDVALAWGRGPSGPYALLLEHDRTRNGSLIETLRAWLDTNGDTTLSAAATHVHPNTFRYRLRRVSEVGGFELDDPVARFGLLLQLKIFRPEVYGITPPERPTHFG